MSVAFTLKQRFWRHKSRMLMMHCRLSLWLTTASLLSVFKSNIFYCRPQKSLPSWVAVWYLMLSRFFHLASCLPYSWSNLISWTDWKRRQSLPLLSVSLIPMEHNFIFSQHCFVSHPWLPPPCHSLAVSSLLIIKSFSNPFPSFKSLPFDSGGACFSSFLLNNELICDIFLLKRYLFNLSVHLQRWETNALWCQGFCFFCFFCF